MLHLGRKWICVLSSGWSPPQSCALLLTLCVCVWVYVCISLSLSLSVGCSHHLHRIFGAKSLVSQSNPKSMWNILHLTFLFNIKHSSCMGNYDNLEWNVGEIFFLFFPFIFISWRLTTLQYCSGVCHTLTWISHGFTCIPHPDPPSHLPLYLIPLGLPSAPGPSTCLMHPTGAADLFHPR